LRQEEKLTMQDLMYFAEMGSYGGGCVAFFEERSLIRYVLVSVGGFFCVGQHLVNGYALASGSANCRWSRPEIAAKSR